MTRTSPLLLAALTFALAATPAGAQTLWHAGNFRTLPVTPGDTHFVPFVRGLSHPSGGYGELSDNRRDHFNLFLTARFDAIDDSVADGDTGDWWRAGFGEQRRLLRPALL